MSGDSVAAVGLLGVSLGVALGDLESITRNDDVGAVSAATNLLAVTAVTKRLIVSINQDQHALYELMYLQ